jgi:hypothetical protein
MIQVMRVVQNTDESVLINVIDRDAGRLPGSLRRE